MSSAVPSFLILDGCAPDGRDHLFGIATTTSAEWWSNDGGRLYTRREQWGASNMPGDGPVSITYRYPTDTVRGAWFMLGARGTVSVDTGTATLYLHEVKGPLRRIRMIGNQLVAVGAHGQVLRGAQPPLQPLNGLEVDASAGRFLLDAIGSGDDELTVVGRRGEAFHWDGRTWHAWPAPAAAGDLHVAHQHDGRRFAGGDGGWLAERVGETWRTIRVPTRDPIVGVCWHGKELWAATPTALFAGSATQLDAVDGPGFGGQLASADGMLYCFGVAHVARQSGRTWTAIEHPDQHYAGPPPAWPVLGDALTTAVVPVQHPAAELGGTLFTDEDIGEAELARWKQLGVRAPVEDMLADPGMYGVLEVEGDLHVRGDLSTFDRKLVGLVVHGDLIVDGIFSDNDHPQTLTIVGGSMRARTIYTSGQLEVRGDVACEHLVGDYNDFSMRVHGKTTARVFYPEYHAFHFDVAPRFELVIGHDAPHRVNREVKAAIRPATGAQLRAALVRAVLNGDEDDEIEVLRKELIQALHAGRSIWAEPSRTGGAEAARGAAKTKPKATARSTAKAKATAKTRSTAKPKPKATAKPKPKATAKRKPTPMPMPTAKPKPKAPKRRG